MAITEAKTPLHNLTVKLIIKPVAALKKSEYV